ncbi:MAG TPA: CHAT domain-containing protein, partial [Thermoanaerobaculia bacterium]|nr:CHAT domain-containing protein [Thermoanaerobaculia bacterium]
THKAGIFDRAGDLPRALDTLAEARRLAQSTGDRVGARRNEAYAAIVRLKMAPPPSDAEIDVLRETARSQPELVATFLQTEAQLRRRQKRFAEAIKLLKESYQWPQSTETRAESISSEAAAWRSIGNRAEAILLLQRAIEAFDDSRLKAGGSERQQRLAFRDATQTYDQLAVLLIEQAKIIDALQAVERGRARTLLEIHERDRSWLPADLSVEEQASVADAQTRIADLDRRLSTATIDERPDLRGKLAEARAALEGVRARLFTARASDREHDTRAAVTVETLASLPRGVTFVEYVAAFDNLYALVVRNAAGGAVVTATKLPGGEKAASMVARQFTARIRQRDLLYAASAAKAYRVLIAPIAEHLDSDSAICFIPTGELWNVPFGALMDKSGRFLVERHAVFYAPSIVVLLSLSRQRTKLHGGAVLAVGDPEVSGESIRSLADVYRSLKLGPLPSARHEVVAIGAISPPRSLTASGADATETMVRRNLRSFDVLHFAVHGIFDNQNPMYSRLIFGSANEEEDGFLEAHEVIAARPQADLVVLSACETARGVSDPGEGLIGLTWAFLATGSRAVVASQWTAESRATATVMIEFHRRRAEGHSTVDSLRQAQLALMRQQRYREPFYWASFILIGAL